MIGRVGRLANHLRAYRRLLASALYALVVALSYGFAYLLRFEFSVPSAYASLLASTLLPLVLIQVAVFHLFRLTRERWRYASTPDVARLSGAVLLGTTVFALLSDVILPLPLRVPLSVLAIEALLTCFLIGAMWASYRLAFEYVKREASGLEQQRVLIIGAGEAGNMLAREMVRGSSGMRPVGFVDDNPHMWGACVRGLDVIGSTSDLPAIAESTRADQLVIAVPSAAPDELRRIVTRCEQTGLPFKVLPGMREVLAGDVRLNQLRDVRISDLLGREPIELALPELEEDLRGRSILITGAAGSIGSELARQVALHCPRTLVLLDQAETDLFYVDAELRERHPGLELVPVIADIVDGAALDRAFGEYRPERVFHAAAYKHVPMMELNPREAVRNNVVGTWRVAETAGRHAVGRFVLVSTDKAVQPSSTMGATKRLAELIVLGLQEQFPGTVFGAVRFGNVLGSNGSVIPVFEKQLREGKPLTITHPDVTRYFMTIPEAVQLILQASLLQELRGHIAMLEMGEPVRIADLARNLLRLSGVPHGAEMLRFIGLRPGEKLHEELIAPDEEAFPTAVPKVRLLQTCSVMAPAIAAHAERWAHAVTAGAGDKVLAEFFDLFPDLRNGQAERLSESMPSLPFDMLVG